MTALEANATANKHAIMLERKVGLAFMCGSLLDASNERKKIQQYRQRAPAEISPGRPIGGFADHSCRRSAPCVMVLRLFRGRRSRPAVKKTRINRSYRQMSPRFIHRPLGLIGSVTSRAKPPEADTIHSQKLSNEYKVSNSIYLFDCVKSAVPDKDGPFPCPCTGHAAGRKASR